MQNYQAEDKNPFEAIFSRIITWREQWYRKDTISDVLPCHGEGENKEEKNKSKSKNSLTMVPKLWVESLFSPPRNIYCFPDRGFQVPKITFSTR